MDRLLSMHSQGKGGASPALHAELAQQMAEFEERGRAMREQAAEGEVGEKRKGSSRKKTGPQRASLKRAAKGRT